MPPKRPIGPVWEVVHWHVASGRTYGLARIAPMLSYRALAPAIGAEQAVEAIVAKHEAMRDGPSQALAASAR